jgi:hypothetical protein
MERFFASSFIHYFGQVFLKKIQGFLGTFLCYFFPRSNWHNNFGKNWVGIHYRRSPDMRKFAQSGHPDYDGGVR